MKKYNNTVIAAAVLLSIFSSVTAMAENEYKGWVWRAWAGGVGRYIESDTVTYNDATFGDITMDVEGTSLGIGADIERQFNRWLGLDLAIGYTDMDVSFKHSTGSGVQTDSLASLNIWLGLNVYLVNTKKFDLWVGPQIAYVAWLDDLSFNVPGTGEYNFKTSNEFPALGFQAGIDWYVMENWGVNAAFRFIDADGDKDHNLPIDQTFVTLGVAHQF